MALYGFSQLSTRVVPTHDLYRMHLQKDARRLLVS